MSSESPQQPNRPPEMPAVKTTIVGGRPPGSGTPIGAIPRGLEILIKKAAVDPEFRALLLEKRSAAAADFELALEPAEVAMLNSVPAEQLEAIIAGTQVPEATRRALLGKITAGTLAAIGVVAVVDSCTLGIRPSRFHTLGVESDRPQTAGVRPMGPIFGNIDRDHTDEAVGDKAAESGRDEPPQRVVPPEELHTLGIRPDRPMPSEEPRPGEAGSRGIRPDRPQTTPGE